jgi:hypothetical protein
MNSATSLANLDELVLLCRDERARTYIEEAVACYRSGAYRSAIVATWIAVCYDIIDKLRELSLAGNGAATQQTELVELGRATNDFSMSLRFERDILTLAKEQFDLISPPEYLDLCRLQEDRNRCAHPTLISQDQGFNPSGELARLHIRSAVIHLLQHQPVQGQYALDRLVSEVYSEYFPTSKEKAIQAFSSGPLKRPRDSLVRNFLLVLLKQILDPNDPVTWNWGVRDRVSWNWRARYRIKAAVMAVVQLHPRISDSTIRERLPDLLRNLPDESFAFGLWTLFSLETDWNILPGDLQAKFEQFVTELPTDEFYNIGELLEYSPLKHFAELRANRASTSDVDMLYEMPSIVADRCVKLLLEATNAEETYVWSSRIQLHAKDFSADQQRRILRGIAKK